MKIKIFKERELDPKRSFKVIVSQTGAGFTIPVETADFLKMIGRFVAWRDTANNPGITFDATVNDTISTSVVADPLNRKKRQHIVTKSIELSGYFTTIPEQSGSSDLKQFLNQLAEFVLSNFGVVAQVSVTLGKNFWVVTRE